MATDKNSPLEAVAGRAQELSGQLGDVRDVVVTAIYQRAEALSRSTVTRPQDGRIDWDRKIDDVLTSKLLGYPFMLLTLGLILWLSITGANYPSGLLATMFFSLETQLTSLFGTLGAANWLHGLVVLGVFRSLGWVISVMLPPMAIFFPLFTLLEDLGYLPRVAFNLDGLFRRAGAHGKQALTMAMGFGCNAAGVMAARIIDSPRERMIAILTNNFMPCNGRFPLLIAMSSLFLGAGLAKGNLVASLAVVGMTLLGVGTTLVVSYLLSHTLLKGVPTSFTLELPPYRKPQILQVLVRSVFDRTLLVLWRAVKVAAPAGAMVWVLANVQVGDLSIIGHAAGFLDPLARFMGLDGFILLAFILGLPANEIVLPILLMSYLGAGALLEFDSLSTMKMLLVSRGWTWLTALNVMVFSLLHFPCGTTLLTIHSETRSWKWTAIAGLLTTGIAVIVCILIAQGVRFAGLVS
ncbi:MAG: ferrous iron transporter B [Firmicutes bacterium]|nr:ferrous iron transporter B [Bacillota bacterium]